MNHGIKKTKMRISLWNMVIQLIEISGGWDWDMAAGTNFFGWALGDSQETLGCSWCSWRKIQDTNGRFLPKGGSGKSRFQVESSDSIRLEGFRTWRIWDRLGQDKNSPAKLVELLEKMKPSWRSFIIDSKKDLQGWVVAIAWVVTA